MVLSLVWSHLVWMKALLSHIHLEWHVVTLGLTHCCHSMYFDIYIVVLGYSSYTACVVCLGYIVS